MPLTHDTVTNPNQLFDSVTYLGETFCSEWWSLICSEDIFHVFKGMELQG